LLVAARVKLTLEHWAVPGLIAAQVPAWALPQMGRNGQTHSQVRPAGKALLYKKFTVLTV